MQAIYTGVGMENVASCMEGRDANVAEPLDCMG